MSTDLSEFSSEIQKLRRIARLNNDWYNDPIQRTNASILHKKLQEVQNTIAKVEFELDVWHTIPFIILAFIVLFIFMIKFMPFFHKCQIN